MSFRDAVMQLKINEIVRKEDEYEFPAFIRQVRKALGLSRKNISEMLLVSETKIYYLEEGKFAREPDIEFVEMLANFYGINKNIIFGKLHEYTEKKSLKKAI